MQLTEAVEEDDPADAVFPLDAGLRTLEEDYPLRAAVSRPRLCRL